MRTYLVILDASEEAELALRFAARRAAKTGGAVEILVIIPRQEFVAWGAVQAAIEEEKREQAEALVERTIMMLGAELGQRPHISIKQGDPVPLIQETLASNADIGALVLGASKVGAPGPLIAHFAGADAGTLPCPLMIVPGALDLETLDRLS